MTVAEWLAVAATAGTGIGTGITIAARILAAVARELVAGQKEQTTAHTAAQRETTAAISELRLELVSLRTRVDTLLDIPTRSSRDSIRDDETPTPTLRGGPYSITRGGRKD